MEPSADTTTAVARFIHDCSPAPNTVCDGCARALGACDGDLTVCHDCQYAACEDCIVHGCTREQPCDGKGPCSCGSCHAEFARQRAAAAPRGKRYTPGAGGAQLFHHNLSRGTCRCRYSNFGEGYADQGGAGGKPSCYQGAKGGPPYTGVVKCAAQQQMESALLWLAKGALPPAASVCAVCRRAGAACDCAGTAAGGDGGGSGGGAGGACSSDGGGSVANATAAIADDGAAFEASQRKCGRHKCDAAADKCTLRCGRCRSVWYCSAKCQRAHWKDATDGAWPPGGHKAHCGKYVPPSKWPYVSRKFKRYKARFGHYPGAKDAEAAEAKRKAGAAQAQAALDAKMAAKKKAAAARKAENVIKAKDQELAENEYEITACQAKLAELEAGGGGGGDGDGDDDEAGRQKKAVAKAHAQQLLSAVEARQSGGGADADAPAPNASIAAALQQQQQQAAGRKAAAAAALAKAAPPAGVVDAEMRPDGVPAFMARARPDVDALGPVRVRRQGEAAARQAKVPADGVPLYVIGDDGGKRK